MPTYTSKGLIKPVVDNAIDEDLWGTQLNANSDKLETLLNNTTASKTADFNVLTTEFNYTYLIDASSAAVTATLPEASTVYNGFVIRFKAIDVTNTITIDGYSNETIDGELSTTIDNVNDAITLVCDGTNWVCTDIIVEVAESSETVSGTVEKATDEEAYDETSNKNITADNAKYLPCVAVAWASFVGTTGAINKSHNITSIVRNTAGTYTVTLAVTMADDDYIIVGNAGYAGSPILRLGGSKTTTTFKLNTIFTKSDGGEGYADYTEVSFIVMGEIA